MPLVPDDTSELSESIPSEPPKSFKLQVYIPWELHAQLCLITERGGENFHGRIYGGFSRIVILALRDYLSKLHTTVPTIEEL